MYFHKILGIFYCKRHPPETLTDCQIVDFVFIFVLKDQDLLKVHQLTLLLWRNSPIFTGSNEQDIAAITE